MITIEINKSAFRHGVKPEDINWAVGHFIYDEPLENYDNKYLTIGFDTSGRLLEIMYNVIDDTTINVFHAMKCRKGFIESLRIAGDIYGKDD